MVDAVHSVAAELNCGVSVQKPANHGFILPDGNFILVAGDPSKPDALTIVPKPLLRLYQMVAVSAESFLLLNKVDRPAWKSWILPDQLVKDWVLDVPVKLYFRFFCFCESPWLKWNRFT